MVRIEPSGWIDAALSGVVVAVHHELRAPLTLISTLAQLARMEISSIENNGAGSAPVRDGEAAHASVGLRLDAIVRSAGRALRTADELLAAHAIAAPGANERPATPLSALVEDLVRDLSAVHAVALTIQGLGDGWDVLVPARRLEVILQSLLANALAHARRGSTIHVRLSHDASDDVRVVIENEIAPVDSHAGSGLGNAIVDLLCASAGCRLTRDASHGRYRVALSVPTATKRRSSEVASAARDSRASV